MGIIIFTVSGPISVLIPIPFLPLVLTAILFWSVLRAASSVFPSPESESVPLTEAITSAKEVIRQVEPASQSIVVTDSKSNGKLWRIFLFSNSTSKRYEVKVDAQHGGVTSWKLA